MKALGRWFYRTFLEHPTENRFTARQFVDEVQRQDIRVGGNWFRWFFGDFVVGVGRRETRYFDVDRFYLEEQIDETELLQTT